MSYQALTADEVFVLYRTVTENAGLAVIVYDNPGTTHFTFTDGLYGRIARLPGIASIKVPGGPGEAQGDVQATRAMAPQHVTIGVWGDAFAATGLNAGCDAWYPVVGGTLPRLALGIVRAAQEGRANEAIAALERPAPLGNLFKEFGGSVCVVAAIAEHLGLVQRRSLPLPIQGLEGSQRARVAEVVNALGVAGQRRAPRVLHRRFVKPAPRTRPGLYRQRCNSDQGGT
ncbi:dihydrodipicolinate synthase family protein [Arthrobacter sp. STN4]|uniref:dihydrodipicolinate synthase family protein n=1 Tax=Arthrobacter sp. STN4 TaxID=2923276 RepID=UPI00277B50A0|nr:dihydrodipicolinate synthase family protein [Arthrobacter sp. STN4]